MTQPNKVLYFKLKNKKQMLQPKDLTLGFDNGTHTFYNLTQTSLVSTDVLESDDNDLKSEFDRVLQKMDNIATNLLEKGFKEVTGKEYKEAEKLMKEAYQNSFMSGFTAEEKIVYEKTKLFLEEYDIYLPAQKQFIVSLRPFIAKGDVIDELYLDEHASKSKKDLNKIFESGVQGVICDFIKELQSELVKTKKNIKKSNRI